MADVANTGGCVSLSFSAASPVGVKNGGIPCDTNRTRFCCPEPLSFKDSVSRRLPTRSSQSLSLPRLGAVQVTAAGCYPTSITWWKKGDQPNMHEIHSAQEYVEALTKAGDKLVLVEFFSVGCRSCKALYPKVCQIAGDNPDIQVLKVIFYDNEALCKSLSVNILPFFHFYRGADGRLDAFSCSLSKVNKLREAVAKYKWDRGQITAPASIAVQDKLLAVPTSTLAVAGSAI